MMGPNMEGGGGRCFKQDMCSVSEAGCGVPHITARVPPTSLPWPL